MLRRCAALIRPLLPALLLWTAGAACDDAGSAAGSASADGDGDIQVEVGGLLLDPASNSPVVVLEEVAGERRLPIWIGLSEARSIAAAQEAEEPIRPNTHDLAKRLVDGLDGAVHRIVVTRLEDGIYYALIHVRRAGAEVLVDARPSDAIAIALRYHAPLFVREGVFAVSGGLEPEHPRGREIDLHRDDDRQLRGGSI